MHPSLQIRLPLELVISLLQSDLFFIMEKIIGNRCKVKTQHGYIIVFVGKKHHLADCRGYAYEHRLVAEKKTGRRLRKGEHVHHIDHDKSNNDPNNLQVAKSMAEHRYLHRRKDSKLKKPEENNYLINCACGCGKQILKFDETNRPRIYIAGHNPPEREAMDALMKKIESGKKSINDLYFIDKSKATVRTTLSRMVKIKMIVRVKPGEYGPLGTPERQNPIIKCACGCGKQFHQFDKGWRKRRYISGHNWRR